MLRGVTVPGELFVHAEVRFTTTDSSTQDALLESVGAEDRSASRTWELVWRVTVADSVIPTLRTHTDIKSVGIPAFICPDG